MGTKTINFGGNNKESRIVMIDYYDCWEDLRDRLGRYLEEKKRNITS